MRRFRSRRRPSRGMRTRRRSSGRSSGRRRGRAGRIRIGYRV